MDYKEKVKNFRMAGKEMEYWKYGYGLKTSSKMVFGNLNFQNKSILEIGGGNGIYCIWAAIHGAGNVINLEPLADGAGVSKASNVYGNFQQLTKNFNLTQVDMLPMTLQEFECEDDSFDIILSQGSINHLDEQSCINLLHDDTARQSYLNLFRKLGRMIKTGGKIIIIDAAPRNYFGDRKKVNPFAKKLDWRKHQEPETWAGLLKECGFHSPIIAWISHKYLRYLGIYSIPRAMAYFIRSAFRLEMTSGK